MASDFFGRSYLVESENLVKLLIKILRSEVNNFIRNNNK